MAKKRKVKGQDSFILDNMRDLNNYSARAGPLNDTDYEDVSYLDNFEENPSFDFEEDTSRKVGKPLDDDDASQKSDLPILSGDYAIEGLLHEIDTRKSDETASIYSAVNLDNLIHEEGESLDIFKKQDPLFKSFCNKFLQEEKKEVEKESGSKMYSKNDFSFYHTKRMLKRYNLKRIGENIYFYDSDKGYYHLLNDNELKTLIRKDWGEDIQKQLSHFVLSDVVERLKTEPTIVVEMNYFNNNELLVNFLNGTLNICTNEFLEHSTSFRLTSTLNASYIPDFSLSGSLFEDFLMTITSNDIKKINHLQEITGYNLSNYSKAKKASVLDGVRHSGKSTYLRILIGIQGPENVSNFPFSELEHRFALGKLSTKKINIFGERGSGILKELETFKALTGGDWKETENKGKDFISYPSTTKLLFAGNSLPCFESADDAVTFMERVTLFIFANAIPQGERIGNMDELLLEERDLITSWAMEGLMRLEHNNFIFNEADDAIAMRNSQVSYANAIEDFLESNCVIEINRRVFSKDLYSVYRDYCYNNGFTALPQKEFTTQVIAKTERMGPVHKKIRIGNVGPYFGFINLGLNQNKLLNKGT